MDFEILHLLEEKLLLTFERLLNLLIFIVNMNLNHIITFLLRPVCLPSERPRLFVRLQIGEFLFVLAILVLTVYG